MLRDARIRTKLIAIFVLPALGTTVLASLRIAGEFRDRVQAGREERAAAVALGTATLAHELGGERDLSAAWLAGNRAAAGRPGVLTARARVDGAVQAFRASAPGAGLARRDPRLRARLDAGLADLDRLPARRQAIDRQPVTVRDTVSFYTEAVGELLDAAARLPAGAGSAHGDLARRLGGFIALAQAEEAASFERGLGAAVTTSGRFQGQDYQRLAASIGARRQELARFQAIATPAQQDLPQTTVDAPRVDHADELEALLLDPRREASVQVAADDWLGATTERVDALRTVTAQLGTEMTAAGRAAVVSSERQLLVNLLVLLTVVVLTFGLAGFLARAMINPLALLEEAARDVAERKLPGVVERLHRNEPVDLDAETTPVEVGAAGEIGRVAAAFTAVQRVAVSVAIDQAALRRSVSEMFVSMARRSQTLVDRQLALIDELERNESDPDRLGQLFKLDHLATRMRRNAESLIVLSGSEPGHPWSRPVPLIGLVRAAVAEIEDYTRVQVVPMAPVELSGQVGIDVVHLLAELVENATAFSAADTAVLIAGEAVSSGYLIEIEDRGIGMSDEELLAANERLASPPLADLTVARMLGFYVIGRLAQRYGIKVRLRHSPYGGVTALVLLPARLLDGPAEGPGPGPAARRPAGPVWAALKQLPRRVTEPELAGEP